MSDEVWKPAYNFVGTYEVSDLGRVRRVVATKREPAGYVLTLATNNFGCPVARLTCPARGTPTMAQVSRLVLTSHLPLPDMRRRKVAYVDGDRANVALTNLYWTKLGSLEPDRSTLPPAPSAAPSPARPKRIQAADGPALRRCLCGCGQKFRSKDRGHRFMEGHRGRLVHLGHAEGISA